MEPTSCRKHTQNALWLPTLTAVFQQMRDFTAHGHLRNSRTPRRPGGRAPPRHDLRPAAPLRVPLRGAPSCRRAQGRWRRRRLPGTPRLGRSRTPHPLRPPPASRVRVMSALPGRKARWRDSAELHPDGRGAIRAQPQPELSRKPEPRGKINPSASPALPLSGRPCRHRGCVFPRRGRRSRNRRRPRCSTAAPLRSAPLPAAVPPPAANPGAGELRRLSRRAPSRGRGRERGALPTPPHPHPSVAGGARRLGRKRRRHDVMRAAMLRFLGMGGRGGCEGAIAAARCPPPAGPPRSLRSAAVPGSRRSPAEPRPALPEGSAGRARREGERAGGAARPR